MSSPAQWWVTLFNTSPSDSLTMRARAPGESSLTRVYTQAATLEEARNRARHVRSQLMQNIRRAARQAKGICRCKRKLDRGINSETGKPYTQCSHCQPNGKSGHTSVSPKEAPLPVPERKDEQPRPGDSIKTVELKLLKRVQFEFQTTGTIGLFKEWLKTQIATREQ